MNKSLARYFLIISTFFFANVSCHLFSSKNPSNFASVPPSQKKHIDVQGPPKTCSSQISPKVESDQIFENKNDCQASCPMDSAKIPICKNDNYFTIRDLMNSKILQKEPKNLSIGGYFFQSVRGGKCTFSAAESKRAPCADYLAFVDFEDEPEWRLCPRIRFSNYFMESLASLFDINAEVSRCCALKCMAEKVIITGDVVNYKLSGFQFLTVRSICRLP